MEVQALSRAVKRWEDDQKMTVVTRDQDSRISKVIRESRWNVLPECDENQSVKVLDRYCQGFPKEERQYCMRS
jgi:hypothetical protein